MFTARPHRAAAIFAALLLLSLVPVRADDTDNLMLESIEATVQSKKFTEASTNQWIRLLQQDDTSIPIKERAAWALGFTHNTDKDTVPALLKAAEHKGLLVRSAAINSLIRLRAKAALPILEKAAKEDPILAVRRNAVLGMGLLESDKSIQSLADISADKSPEVRGAAALAMSALQSKKNDFRSLLKEMLADEDPSVQDRAKDALTLAEHKNASARPLLSSTDRDVRLFAALYFQRNGNAADKKSVQAAFDGESDEEIHDMLADANAAIKKRSTPKKNGTASSTAKKKRAKTKSTKTSSSTKAK